TETSPNRFVLCFDLRRLVGAQPQRSAAPEFEPVPIVPPEPQHVSSGKPLEERSVEFTAVFTLARFGCRREALAEQPHQIVAGSVRSALPRPRGGKERLKGERIGQPPEEFTERFEQRALAGRRH